MERMTRDEIGRRFRQLREQTGLTQKQVSELLGRNQQSINHWETGYSQPNIETLIELLNLYGIDSIFTPNQRFQRNLSQKEMSLLSAYRKAPGAIQAAARRLLGVSDGDGGRPGVRRELPVYRFPASGRTDRFLDGDDFTLETAAASVPPEATMGVRVRGDSVSPMAEDGQVVWVRRQNTLEHGDIGLFLLDGEVLVRRLSNLPDRLSLVSVNARYEPIPVEEEQQLRILGKVLI